MGGEALVKVQLYRLALRNLWLDDTRWSSNKNKFDSWDTDTQLWWIKRIEGHAADGPPMAVELVMKALEIRMTK
ncbi:hypothetical protein [Herminiimonas sp. CN]|uniref:hypothetical protein n=1 Tax=Herminiimonas sp. CN TaxID=1349818 RepID=UPI00047390CF|nr:hypothetical protein [Herminiimonas sp. CN]